MISPVSVSSAAPTLNFEKSATACSRAARAAATIGSIDAAALALEPANDPLEERNELPFDLLGGLHHFGVVQRLREDAGSRIGDARDAEDLNPHVSGHDRF